MARTFSVEVHRLGLFRFRFTAPANETKGLMPVPDFSECAKHLRKYEAEALQRGVWTIEFSDVLRCDLRNRAGKNIGALFARVT